MAHPVTEIVYLTLKPSIDISVPGPAADIWHQTLSTIAAQDGYRGVIYGTQLENPNILMTFIHWTSIDRHQAFIDSEIYGPFAKNLQGIVTDIYFHHFRPSSYPPALLTDAPVIEVVTFYDTEPGFHAAAQEFGRQLQGGKVDGYFGNVDGEVVERVRRRSGDGAEGPAVVLLIGWESKEAHLRFRETPLFAEHVGLLRKGNGGVEMVHVKFTKFEG
ncbi:hypothetical protein B0O99DRAFT_604388 [Bisporella sp. PMI_857]|nr:hypothetical protein B0O99DRAFT_604388 [Bisporella sp. PMI_857]